MYNSHEKEDMNRLHKYISVSSPKYKSSSHPIVASLQRFTNMQQIRFEELQKACEFLQECLTNTQQTVAKLDQRIHQIQQMRSTETISNLKQKQSQFIIHQLREKIKKYQKNEQNMEIELKHLKKQLQSVKRQQKLAHNQKSLKASRVKEDISQMQKVIAQKDAYIQQLNRKMTQLIEEKKEDKKVQQNAAQKLKKNKDDEFRLLEAKLLDLERDFDSKVSTLQQEVKQKTLTIRKLEDEIEKKRKQTQFKQKEFQIQLKSLQQSKSLPSALIQSQQLPSNMTLTFNPVKKSIQPKASESSSNLLSASTYQLELKLSHQLNLYKQLELEYTTHLTQCNNLEIQLHQQIHQQKNQLQDQKKKYKTQKKKTIQLLQSLPSVLNKRTFNYFDSNSQVETLVQEVKKLIVKQKEKWEKQLQQAKSLQEQHDSKITELEKQNRKLKSQNNLVKQQMQNISQQLQRLVTQRQKEKQKQRQKDKEKQEKQLKLARKESESGKGENSSNIKENSSFITESNKSNSNSRVKFKQSLNGSFGESSNNAKSETLSLLEEKYKITLDSLKTQIQQKEQHIAELQNLQSIEFERSKEKILAIESQLADSRNEVKKMQRQGKQLKQKIAEASKQIESLKLTIQQIKEKQLREKQTLLANHEQKVKILEEKITKLKDQNQQIDSKCQEKVMKYNKLKSKVQKLQMYNSQTEKRKDSQIQDLIKKNQHLKMDYKLLQEKLNLAQTLQMSNTTDGQEQTPKTTYAYNKDLIEQIQMQRDRILEQYETKRRQNIKLKDQYDKQSIQINQLKQEISKLEQYKEKAQKQRQSSSEDKQKLTLQTQKLAQQTQKTIAKLVQQKQSLNSQLANLKKELSNQRILKQDAQKELAKINDQNMNKSKQEYQHLKKELQSQLQTKKKLQKEQQALVERIKQLKDENQKVKKQNGEVKKQLIQKAKSLQVRWQQKYKQKMIQHHEDIAKVKDEYLLKIKDLQQKISQAQIREQNLVNIINYKNMSVSGNIRESMKGDEDEYKKREEEEVKQYDLHELLPISEVKEIELGQVHDAQTNTEKVQTHLGIYSMEDLRIQTGKMNGYKLTMETLPVVQILPSIVRQTDDQYSQVNIFDQTSEVIHQITKSYPEIIQQVVSNTKNQLIQEYEQKINIRIKQNEQNHRHLQKMAAQNKQVVFIGINTEESYLPYVKVSQPVKCKVCAQNHKLNGIRESSNRESVKSKSSRAKQASFILDKDWLGSDQPSHSSVQHMPIPQSSSAIPPTKVSSRQKFDFQSNKVGNVNLFENLKPSLNLQIGLEEQNLDDNFQICQQGQSINVGRTAVNLQIKEIFNKLREQLQKVFNGQEISLSMIKILPRQLQDDYNEFIGYVRQKIIQIKTMNQLSFIMAQVGEGAQELQDELQNELRTFIDKKTSQDIFTYKRLVQQKQALITSLMNQRTMQQNTINQMTMQKQQMDEQHQNRFMNQCNIYKKEIKELKNKVDNLEMNFMSLRNIYKNTMEIWVDEMENEDDLRDNLMVYRKIGRLNQSEGARLNYYMIRYRQIKGVE